MRKLNYIFIAFVFYYCNVFSQSFWEFSGNEKKVKIVKTEFACIVKYESKLADFYFDGETVQKWINESLYDTSKNYYKIYHTVANEKDKITYSELSKIRAGDTIAISELKHSRLSNIIEINIKDLFLKNDTVKMQIYDKGRKEYVNEVYGKVFTETAGPFEEGKRFSLFNATYNHYKLGFFSLSYDWCFRIPQEKKNISQLPYYSGKIILHGVYKGKNIFVQNPLSTLGSFCITQIIVNGHKSTRLYKFPSIEIKIEAWGGVKVGDSVKIEIVHDTNCLPKIYNPEAIAGK